MEPEAEQQRLWLSLIASVGLHVAMLSLAATEGWGIGKGGRGQEAGQNTTLVVRLAQQSPHRPPAEVKSRVTSSPASPNAGVPVATTTYHPAHELSIQPAPVSEIPLEVEVMTGRLVLRLLINGQGTVDRAETVESAIDPRTEAALINRFSAARYRPGMIGERPVPSEFLLEIVATPAPGAP